MTTAPVDAENDTRIAPFPVHIPESEIVDLRTRLEATRWPDAETVDDRSQGVPLTFLTELCRHWARDYDWRRVESRLNAMPQFVTSIDGLDLHFMHVTSPHAGATPLLMIHGWPGSIVEFLDVANLLADPVPAGGSADDAFHVVCPSLPGFGFSGRPASPGWGSARTAVAFRQLMSRLGYERYGLQGGDWGARVSREIGATEPRVLGTHLNFVMVDPPADQLTELTGAERAAIARVAEFDRWDRGYAGQQSTRPQTIGYGLNDSPAGLAAWLVEKLIAWTDPRGETGMGLSIDQMLDNISLYWFTQTATSSARFYWESFGEPSPVPDGPVGCSVFPYELRLPSRRWAERVFPDLRYWNEPDRGGHFAAWEQPHLLADEVRAFFRLTR